MSLSDLSSLREDRKKIGYFAAISSGISRNGGTTRPMNILGSMLATREERVEDRKVGQCTRVPTCEPADRCLEYRGTGIVHDPLLIVATRILNFSQLFISYNDYFLIEEKRCHDLSCTSLQIIIIIIKLSYQRGLPQLISSFFLLHSFICFVVELRKDAYSYLYIYLYYKYIMKFVGVTVSNSNIHDRSSRNIFRTPCFHTNIPPFVTTLINVARMFPSRIYTCTFPL